MSTLQVNTIQTNTPAGVLAVRDVNDALTAIKSGAVQGSAAGAAPVFQDSAGTEIGTLCRAWVNFNGTGTVAIRAAFNVSSITDIEAGSYWVNFSEPLQDNSYAAVVSGGRGDGASTTNVAASSVSEYSTTQFRYTVEDVDAGFTDYAWLSAAVFR
jgi:hypothetical protein